MINSTTYMSILTPKLVPIMEISAIPAMSLIIKFSRKSVNKNSKYPTNNMHISLKISTYVAFFDWNGIKWTI